MLDLIEHGSFDVSTWVEIELALGESFQNDFQGSLLQLDGGVQAVDLGAPWPMLLIGHPLEGTRRDHLTSRLAEAWAEAESRDGGRGVIVDDVFNLLRRPGFVAARVRNSV
jgi:hypothetical protein